MTKREREILALIKGVGLELQELTTSGGNHYRSVVKAPNGRASTVMFSNTPSCSRADLNNRSHLRRFYKQNSAGGQH